jgi:hypothetical protein
MSGTIVWRKIENIVGVVLADSPKENAVYICGLAGVGRTAAFGHTHPCEAK